MNIAHIAFFGFLSKTPNFFSLCDESRFLQLEFFGSFKCRVSWSLQFVISLWIYGYPFTGLTFLSPFILDTLKILLPLFYSKLYGHSWNINLTLGTRCLWVFQEFLSVRMLRPPASDSIWAVSAIHLELICHACHASSFVLHSCIIHAVWILVWNEKFVGFFRRCPSGWVNLCHKV